MNPQELVATLAKEKYTNPTGDDVLFVAKMLAETALDCYSREPTDSRYKDWVNTERYYESLRGIQVSSSDGPQG